MNLNEIRDNAGATKNRKRVGRGIGSGTGKTAARGVKGQKSRSGVSLLGFEGGQMPIHRRLPKFGFASRKAQYVAEIRLNELTLVEGDTVDLAALKAADVIGEKIKEARVILSGEISKAVTVKGLKCTKGAKAAIEAAGGKVED